MMLISSETETFYYYSSRHKRLKESYMFVYVCISHVCMNCNKIVMNECERSFTFCRLDKRFLRHALRYTRS